jgi:hypothetical protein
MALSKPFPFDADLIQCLHRLVTFLYALHKSCGFRFRFWVKREFL